MPSSLEGLKVALVHDWLVGQGGGERVLYDLHCMFPEAPIYTLVYDEAKAPAWCGSCDIRTTYIQKIPGARSHHKILLSLMPRAWEALDLMEFDLVISSCTSCCKGILTRPDAVHICYCHSPIRYVWDLYYDYLGGTDSLRRAAMRRIIPRVREWDYLAAQRVDQFVSNSDYVGKRIKKFYRREATTIYPGTNINPHPVTEEADDYYLVVSRFVRYKRIDLAIEACNRLARRLVIIGAGGEEENRLREMAGPTIEFLGHVTDEEMQRWYSRARAFLFPGIEDYGITPVEAASAGVPTLAYGAGGALETVRDGKTGLYFHEQSAEALAECIERFEREGVSLTRQQIHDYSLGFSNEVFRERMTSYLTEKLAEKGIIDNG